MSNLNPYEAHEMWGLKKLGESSGLCKTQLHTFVGATEIWNTQNGITVEHVICFYLYFWTTAKAQVCGDTCGENEIRQRNAEWNDVLWGPDPRRIFICSFVNVRWPLTYYHRFLLSFVLNFYFVFLPRIFAREICGHAREDRLDKEKVGHLPGPILHFLRTES